MRKEDWKTTKKRGEEGYWERNTEAAHKATAEAHSTFKTAEEFTAAANKYFDDCDATGELYGEAGLCLSLAKSAGCSLKLNTLRGWYDGTACAYLQDAVQTAYLRIQQQIESDPRYREKGGMATRAIFLQKQSRFGGYQDRFENKQDSTVKILFGDSVDNSDFK